MKLLSFDIWTTILLGVDHIAREIIHLPKKQKKYPHLYSILIIFEKNLYEESFLISHEYSNTLINQMYKIIKEITKEAKLIYRCALQK